MQTAYDPVRIQALTTRVAQASDQLATIRCNDPAAGEALRALRLTRTNLEELWLPLLHQIHTSQAMISWLESTRSLVTRGQEMIVDWIADRSTGQPQPPDDEFTRMTDEQLAAFVGWCPIDDLPFDATGAPTSPASELFASLAAALAARVEADDEFADRLLAISRDNHVVAFSTGIVAFPPDFVEQLARRMIVPPSPFDDLGRQLSAAAATSTVLRALVELDPAHSLDLLADEVAVRALAGWPMLDQSVVAELVHRGLYTAVARDPNRMIDGYGVLRRLTELAAGDFDDGFTPGMSLGVAGSMVGYVDTLATGLGLGTKTTVTIHEVGAPGLAATSRSIAPFTIELGTYDDVRKLFGAICRESEAQAAIGLTLGAYTTAIFDRLGTGTIDDSTIRNVARFGELIGASVDAEQAEMIAAAAAASSRRRALGEQVSFAIGQAASAVGAGPVVAAAVSKAAQFGAARFADVEAETMPDVLVRDSTYLAIVVGAVRAARIDPSSVDPQSADDDAQLARVDDKLALIDELAEAGDRAGYEEEVEALMALVGARTPQLERALLAVTDLPTVEALRGS